jgi:hypothetical protein
VEVSSPDQTETKIVLNQENEIELKTDGESMVDETDNLLKIDLSEIRPASPIVHSA